MLGLNSNFVNKRNPRRLSDYQVTGVYMNGTAHGELSMKYTLIVAEASKTSSNK